MKDINIVFLMGNLTRDPELRYTPNGQAVSTFSVATNRRWTDASGEKKDAVEYTDIVAWGKMAETVTNYLKKGSRLHVMGRLQTRSWEAQDGSKRSKTEIIANDITFIDRAGKQPDDTKDTNDETPEKNGKKSKNSKKEEPAEPEEVSIEDIPF